MAVSWTIVRIVISLYFQPTSVFLLLIISINLFLGLTDCMEQSPWWEADSHAAGDGIPRRNGTEMFIRAR
jgi:hypothetical protein